MTTAVASSAPPARAVRVLRPIVALLQLAAIGLAGTIVFTVLLTLMATGIGLAPVLGLGLPLLVAFVYGLWLTGWLEYARVDGLYRLDLPALEPRRSGRPGFGGWLRTVWLQFVDGRMWRGVAHAGISTVLGIVVFWLAGILASGIALIFAPLYATGEVGIASTGIAVPVDAAVLVGALAVLVSAAVLAGIALLHGILVQAILVPSREAQLVEAARTAGMQREGAVRASELERTRIERDLHDGVQPRLVSVGMTLGLAQQKIDDDPDAAKQLLAEAHTSTKAAITELRQLARGIHASVLDDRGLDAALSALAARSHVPVHLDVRVDQRCGRTAEAAVYFAIAESLTNAAKHSRAAECRVVVRHRDDHSLWARVEDNGVGGARVIAGGGLDGIINRITAAGGATRLDSPAGGPTALEVSVPCAS
ncbi:sensor histidine kinase [Microbacterium oleivorans]|uniref:histidine kinase n=1 Tax=Microbacterium oleivorans TaxID=273677 RepID=A0A7D5JXU4_9MICO|nr:histidine kinase [Microbacterium oleivorans]QLD11303.1 sensor domain-containing protein [Microbacterium oleivorans]